MKLLRPGLGLLAALALLSTSPLTSGPAFAEAIRCRFAASIFPRSKAMRPSTVCPTLIASPWRLRSRKMIDLRYTAVGSCGSKAWARSNTSSARSKRPIW